ncbi:hypothetical protein FRX31_024465, partial [Thalictrum thalictroides]
MASLPPATIKVQQPKDTSKTCRLVGGSSNKMTHVYESSFTSSRKWDGLPQLHRLPAPTHTKEKMFQ